MSVGNGQLSFSVPPGVNHDLWTSRRFAPFLLQSVSDLDFEIEVKFDSQPSGRYALNGLVVEADDGDLLRFDFYSSGSTIRIFAAEFNSNTAMTKYSKVINVPAGSSMYMRLQRSGDAWTQSYSFDGDSWTLGRAVQ